MSIAACVDVQSVAPPPDRERPPKVGEVSCRTSPGVVRDTGRCRRSLALCCVRSFWMSPPCAAPDVLPPLELEHGMPKRFPQYHDLCLTRMACFAIDDDDAVNCAVLAQESGVGSGLCTWARALTLVRRRHPATIKVSAFLSFPHPQSPIFAKLLTRAFDCCRITV